MRGEHTTGTEDAGINKGSSPHARGAWLRRRRRRDRRGIIPACAGSMPGRSVSTSRPRDHPRMRGEHGSFNAARHYAIGSSPHARGAFSAAVVDRVHDGIIPACAGSIDAADQLVLANRDHPRMRGEHESVYFSQAPHMGSSPHARGASLRPDPWQVAYRIIPAGAGSIRPATEASSPDPDHPRMRGEHEVDVRTAQGHAGSSPHARGGSGALAGAGLRNRIIPACAGSIAGLTRPARDSGIIPACAGSMTAAQPTLTCKKDHPRMRGEHAASELSQSWRGGGSSPHARGACTAGGFGRKPVRIIPACAGSMPGTPPTISPSWDHPRMRGEHEVDHRASAAASGSSPHARGAFPGQGSTRPRPGIIPACAGSMVVSRR